ncbi:MAG: PID-CTERM protein-sorting domain-containing protein [Bacteroidales bacterium]
MRKTILILITFVGLCFISYWGHAQNPPHPNGGSSPGWSNTPVGGSAPVDGGIAFLLLMAAGYGVRKIYRNHKLLNL